MSTEQRYYRYINEILPGMGEYCFTNKEKTINNYVRYMLARTQQIFRWNNLPETIPARMLELYLQTNGNTCFYRHEDSLYVFTGGLGGEPDVYYMPTIYTIANPALNMSVNAKIDIDCVVMPNDSMYMGLLPMFTRYATQLTENDISLNLATINSRIIALLSAQDDSTREACIEYLEKIKDGDMGVIAENTFLEGIRVQPYGNTSNTNMITNLIEYQQYTKASWFNEIGLNANYNMKRESLNSAESELNNDALIPLIDDMLNCRRTFADKVNEMFDTNISVELTSAWEDNQQELDAELENIDVSNEVEETEVIEDEETENNPE